MSRAGLYRKWLVIHHNPVRDFHENPVSSDSGLDRPVHCRELDSIVKTIEDSAGDFLIPSHPNSENRISRRECAARYPDSSQITGLVQCPERERRMTLACGSVGLDHGLD